MKNGSISNTKTGKVIIERFDDENVASGVDKLLKRIDTLEKAVEKLTDMLETGPGMVSMMADMADEGVRRSAERGVDVDERLRVALEMAEKLTAPAMMEKFNGLIELAEQAPGMVSMFADIADEGMKRAADSGVDIDARLKSTLELAEKLTAPEMTAKLNQAMQLADQAPGLISMFADMADDGIKRASDNGIDLEERVKAGLQMLTRLSEPSMIDRLSGFIEMTEQLPGLTAMGVDVLDDGIQTAARNGFEVDTLVQKGLPALINFSNLIVSEEFNALLESGIMDKETIQLVGNAGKALKETTSEEVKKVGLWGMVGAMGDSDRKRAIGFLMQFAKNFGKGLK